ncbi:MAG: tRNA pseudouridine(38-40) synthase TruA [Proteobacteria bacterium]|nr:tRNA pseudouridine(38-40) synthase TruA [Pseudomonadota bacterium]
MPKICLIIEYDGAAFHGWQFQAGVTTVQRELHSALETFLRTPVSELCASGRTDAGVHASAQVVTFVVPQVPDLARLAWGISSILRGKLAVLSAAVVPETFHPREDALSKRYRYRILNRYAPAVLDKGRMWEVQQPLDLERMRRAAAEFVGEHDFAAFRAAGCTAKTTIRTIFESELTTVGPEITYRVRGSGFLRYMVRNIVGTLVGIGDGSLGDCTIAQIIASRDRAQAGVTAPPYGLYLDSVYYEAECGVPKPLARMLQERAT